MTSLFPHTPYAEDQPSSHPILYAHITRAATMTTTFLSLITAPTSYYLLRTRRTTPFPPLLLTHSSRALALGTAAGLAMTYARMRGKEEIEWQDRSWRLLENRGEVWTDWWCAGGAGVGSVLAGLAKSRGGLVGIGMARAVVGGAGLGIGSGVVFMIGTFGAGRKEA